MTFDSKPTKEQRQLLGLLIYRYRMSVGMTQEELAELLEYSPRWIQKIESGQANPNWSTLIKIMELFQISPTQIAEEVGIHVFLHPIQRNSFLL